MVDHHYRLRPSLRVSLMAWAYEGLEVPSTRLGASRSPTGLSVLLTPASSEAERIEPSTRALPLPHRAVRCLGGREPRSALPPSRKRSWWPATLRARVQYLPSQDLQRIPAATPREPPGKPWPAQKTLESQGRWGQQDTRRRSQRRAAHEQPLRRRRAPHRQGLASR